MISSVLPTLNHLKCMVPLMNTTCVNDTPETKQVKFAFFTSIAAAIYPLEALGQLMHVLFLDTTYMITRATGVVLKATRPSDKLHWI